MSFEQAVFKFSWRPYQQRVLNALENHTKDEKLHVVAPPGSGKTVLGLEVARQLNQPTLILAPNLTIRNQWIQRFTELFLNGEKADWITVNVKQPKFLTITTYQALHAAQNSNDTDLLNLFLEAGIQTFVVDECHHLQKAWWQSLMTVFDKLKPTLVALTATPPYDVNAAEWARYNELCGQIDVEIKVPELVAEKNLCYHQDYIYFSQPTSTELDNLERFHSGVDQFIKELPENSFFVDLVKSHPFLSNPKQHLDSIYEAPEFLSSLMIFLNAMNRSIPIPALDILGANIEELPDLDKEWLEVLLNQTFFEDEFLMAHLDSEFLQLIKTDLKRIGALEKRKIELIEPPFLEKTLRTSNGKLEGIVKIVDTESRSLKADLRMVILTDYIRKEFLPGNKYDIQDISQIGVVPIFELLRRQFPVEIDMAVLSGSLVILPKIALQLFLEIVKEAGYDEEVLKLKPLVHDDNYYLVSAAGKAGEQLTQWVTALFMRGRINVLVGTKSLLGEGWDAPAINSLILATFVGSYVLSNQMRGRAIRTMPGVVDKTANIWHLVCLDHHAKNGGSDFARLKRRFKAFHGVSFEEKPGIENGIQRFRLPEQPILPEKLLQLNKIMLEHAEDRKRLKAEWEKGLENGVNVIEQIKIPVAKTKRVRKIKELLITNGKVQIQNEIDHTKKVTFQFWSAQLGIILTTYLLGPNAVLSYCIIGGVGLFHLGYVGLPRAIKDYNIWKKLKVVFKPKLSELYLLIAVISVIGIVASLALVWQKNLMLSLAFLVSSFLSLYDPIMKIFVPNKKNSRVLKNVTTYNNHLQIAKRDITDIGKSLLKTLCELKVVQSDYLDVALNFKISEEGYFTAYLTGSTDYEEHQFIDAFQEILQPVQNPRYLLKVNKVWLKNYSEELYYNVPAAIGKHKKNVELFAFLWTKYTNQKTTVIFTRNEEGRQLLLKARGKSFGLLSDPKTQKLSAWK